MGREMNGEVKTATVHLNPAGRIDVTCPHCGWMAPRTRSYVHSLRYVLRCNRCMRLFRVPFAGAKK